MLKPKMCRGRAPGAFSERSLWLKNPAKCLDNKGWISTAPRVSKIDIQTDAVEPHCVKVQSCSHKSFCFFRALSNPLLQNRPFALIHPILRWSQVKSNFVIAKCCKMLQNDGNLATWVFPKEQPCGKRVEQMQLWFWKWQIKTSNKRSQETNKKTGLQQFFKTAIMTHRLQMSFVAASCVESGLGIPRKNDRSSKTYFMQFENKAATKLLLQIQTQFIESSLATWSAACGQASNHMSSVWREEEASRRLPTCSCTSKMLNTWMMSHAWF